MMQWEWVCYCPYPPSDLLGSRKCTPLCLGSFPRCARVPEALPMADPSSELHPWAGAMSRLCSQPLLPQLLDLSVHWGASGCLDGTGNILTS